MPQNTGYQNPVTPSTGYQNPTQPGGGYISPKPPKKSGSKKPIIWVSIIVAVVVVILVITAIFVWNMNPNKWWDDSVELTPPAEGTFDIEWVRRNITVDGQKISIPTTLQELGDGWSFEYGEPFEFDGCYFYKVYYKSNYVFSCYFEEYNKNRKRSAIITGIIPESPEVSIDGLRINETTAGDVLKKYGEPDYIVQVDDTTFYYKYGINSEDGSLYGRYLSLRFDSDKTSSDGKLKKC